MTTTTSPITDNETRKVNEYQTAKEAMELLDRCPATNSLAEEVGWLFEQGVLWERRRREGK